MLNMRKDETSNDLLILVNKNDEQEGYATKLKCHEGNGILHRAFSVFLLNSKNELILQKRSENKPLWPLYWSNSVCSHPRKDELLSDATQRRLKEELNVESSRLKKAFHFTYQASYKDVGSENEFCHVYYGRTFQSPAVNENEIAEIKEVSLKEAQQWVKNSPEAFTPWFLLEWERVLPHLEKLSQHDFAERI
jgi:isopentenyl-diphosphate delta-isomerase